MKKNILVILLIICILSSFNSQNDSKYLNQYRQLYSGERLIRASEYLKNRANDHLTSKYENGNKHEMYSFVSSDDNQVEDFRYIGREANNYLYFNCLNEEDVNSCEVWRIVGLFQKENNDSVKEYYLKIVRNESIGKFKWNNDENNDWQNSSLFSYLNFGEYYNSLNEKAKSMIEPFNYYLDNPSIDSKDGYQYYSQERSNNNFVISNVGLLYPSDYLFTYGFDINKNCYSNLEYCENIKSSWFYKIASNPFWSISSISDTNQVFVISNNKITISEENKTDNNIERDEDNVNSLLDNNTALKEKIEDNINNLNISYNSTINEYDVYPVVYLKYNVSIVSGNGCKGDPYSIVLLNESDIQKEQDVLNNMDKNTDKSNVNVDNTSSYNSVIIFVVSILLVIFGVLTFSNNIIKSKKEKKK